MGIEPTLSAWEAEVLPLNYTRDQKTEDRGLTTDFRGLLRNALYQVSVDRKGYKNSPVCQTIGEKKSSTIFFTKVRRLHAATLRA